VDEVVPESFQGQETGTETSGLLDGGINPAWQPFLNEIPRELHQKVMPHLQQWDKGVNDRFQQVHSEYEPWKRFQQAGLDPDNIEQAWGVYQTMNNNPAEFGRVYMNWLAEQGIELPGQGQTGQQLGQEEDIDPNQQRIDQLSQQQELIAQVLLQRQQEESIQQEDAQLAQEFDQLHQKFSQERGLDFDENWVLSRLMADPSQDPEDVIGEYYDFVNNLLTQQQRPVAPRLLGSGGSMPTQRPNVGQMTESQVKQYAMERFMNNRAAAEGY
jgi:hypothetical protein